MANQIDQFPYYDQLTKRDNFKMDDVWIAALSSFIDTLNGYLSEFGMFMPVLTTAQRNTIQSPVNGQLIYNSDLGSAQYFKAGVWTSF
jgi:hypothetical protein